ncbi:hypothetical protein MRB53_001662 [Persea americana]|uniref:Uncharacterized protein n=1 Tax=Persea americana TaxID=3435 RepID=A0ACC2MSI1_PERAE|nr:hypothetical protein MRB53_001662 [Persea americana]
MHSSISTNAHVGDEDVEVVNEGAGEIVGVKGEDEEAEGEVKGEAEEGLGENGVRVVVGFGWWIGIRRGRMALWRWWGEMEMVERDLGKMPSILLKMRSS